MDPASLALAVVGLGLQLVQMTTSIREKINAYKSAAQELSSLSEKLENIEVIFHSLEVAFNGYEESSRPWDVVLLRQLYKIMRDCSDKVLRLHDMINMIFASQTRRIKPFGALGALFLQHRGALRKCSNELDQSLASLHSNMTGNILVMLMTSPTRKLNSTPTLTVDAPNDEITSGPQIIQPRRTMNIPDMEIKLWRHSWSFFYYLEYVTIRKKSPSQTCNAAQEESTLLISSPLLRVYIKLSIQRGSLSPLTFSIQFPHVMVLEDFRDLNAELQWIMNRNDLVAFQALLTEGPLTLATRLASPHLYPGNGISLLGLAIIRDAYDIADFLMPHYSVVLEGNHLPETVSHTRVSSSVVWGCAAPIYIDFRKDSLAPSEFQCLLQKNEHPIPTKHCIEAYKRYFSDNWILFGKDVWNNIVMHFITSAFFEEIEFDTTTSVYLVTELVGHGFDIHSKAWAGIGDPCHGLTALQGIMEYPDNPCDGLGMVKSWVDVLERCNVDIQQYLTIEIDHCTSSWAKVVDFNSCGLYTRQFAVQEFQGRKLPCWVMTCDQSCSTPDLMAEFPHLNYGSSNDDWLDWSEVQAAQDHKAWKFVIMEQEFPFLEAPSRRHLNWSLRHGPSMESWMRFEEYTCYQKGLEGLQYACDLVESRFEHRRIKKLRKTEGIKKLKPGRRLPGSWVDGDF
ncbi:hypothetical protein BKA56DRAFT_598526 [Ilyonectria sp. MPI-CAGE-AT-0026]|nr:hypothetical protein BKA56DRAFT_598526 [Ilyonectria sp. MPI-CAGE-AT-0026]